MKPSSWYRTRARVALRGRYLLLVAARLFESLLTSAWGGLFYLLFFGMGIGFFHHFSPAAAGLLLVVSAIVLTVCLAMGILIGSAMTAGYSRLVLKAVHKEEADWKDMLFGFKNLLFLRLFGASLLVGLAVIACALVEMILFFVIALTGEGNMAVGIAALILMVPSCLAVIYVELGFSQYVWLLVSRPECRVFEALSLSWKKMRGKRVKLFCLQFSFIGWYLLGSLSMGIGMLWIRPYIMTSEAMFYLDLVKEE